MAATWLVTGSSRGLGRSIVTAALDAGEHVVATARRPEQLDDLVTKYGDAIRAVGLDVTDAASARAAVAAAVEAFGSLDVVVNNAGYADTSPFEETPDDVFRAQIETNLFGVVNVTKAAIPVLRAQRGGRIIQISSIGGRVGGTPGLAAYQTAKFGVAGLSEVVRNEVAPFGIKVTVVEPGGFRTDWAGASMAVPSVGEGYDQTVGELARRLRSSTGAEPGDPARAAAALLDIARHPDPPARLLLGAHALELAREASDLRAAEAEKWADVTRSADFPA